ncbi:MAG: hypothetical protein FJ144_17695 [Deltaproteobacteria bacterium]|nr:hypothetical protein [Deltaproteobacteria bacterium]
MRTTPGRHRGVILAAVLVAAFAARETAAQPAFDHMKCYKIKDPEGGKQYTTDLVPEITHDFVTELGDRIVGGFLVPGCRIKMPAKFFCIDTRTENAHDVKPPYDPSSWMVPGAESGERLCYKLLCPPVLPKSLDVIDQFGARTIELRGRTEYLCTPVVRQNPSTDPCEMAGNGQCGGTCGPGERCLALSGEECSCLPESSMCASSLTCSEGHCGGVWETCVTLPIGGCGCSHPP